MALEKRNLLWHSAVLDAEVLPVEVRPGRAILVPHGNEQMAVEQMARIGKEITSQFAIGRVGMIHRLGRLEIGEVSVAVVTTAPHRRPAFDAALEGINRLKREVPIWKKEFFADGAVWVDGEWDERLLQSTATNDLR